MAILHSMAKLVNYSNAEPISARALLLRLMSVPRHRPLHVSEAVKSGAVFGIVENSIRVALTRLLKDGLIEATERGLYHLSAKGRQLGEVVSNWRGVEDQIRDWQGDWLAVATTEIPRSDRKVLRHLERAFSLSGLRDLGGGIYVRPNNIVGEVPAMRAKLSSLETDKRATVFRMCDLAAHNQAKAEHLWDDLRLSENYARWSRELDDNIKFILTLPKPEAVREVFLVGDVAIKRVLFDPLLPAKIVHEPSRREFFQKVRQFDDLGHGIWTEFLG